MGRGRATIAGPHRARARRMSDEESTHEIEIDALRASLAAARGTPLASPEADDPEARRHTIANESSAIESDERTVRVPPQADHPLARRPSSVTAMEAAPEPIEPESLEEIEAAAPKIRSVSSASLPIEVDFGEPDE